ncbi:MAG: transglutaminase family protein, partial [Nitriliruptoraceae bacterium]
MRLDIRHVTRFDYSSAVWESQNELRACPVTDERQQLLYYDVVTTPTARTASYIDYWGTRVDSFGIREPHTALEVVAASHVETRPVETALPHTPVDALADPAFCDAHYTFLQPSPHVAFGGLVRDAARDSTASAADVATLVESIHQRVGMLDYRPGSTEIGVSVDAVLASGSGVCQDFAHVAIAMYRSVGVPARYVSGYFFAGDDSTGEDVASDEVEVATHAWVEVALPGIG